jgi:[ribosomal protein S5]-alanine N-acetyltransferase
MQPLNLQAFPVLHTDRLTLNALTLNDDAAIFALRSDDKVNEFLGRKKAETISDAQDFILKINKSVADNESIYWSIRLKNTDTLIGTICFWNLEMDNASVEIGYELLPVYQGKGLMQEALKAVIQFGFRLGFQTITAYSDAKNVASIKLLERHHFKLNASDSYELRNDEK